MKYHISREQRFFFDQNSYIEFDGLLLPDEEKRLAKSLAKVDKGARDLSLKDGLVKEVVHSIARAKLAAELAHVRLLRFGFDELFVPGWTTKNLMNEVCIQGLVICLFLTLDGEGGHGIYAKPSVDLDKLPLDPNRRYLVIGWAEERSMYVLQPNDPYTHELKKRGYVFGDRLKEEWHPVVIR